ATARALREREPNPRRPLRAWDLRHDARSKPWGTLDPQSSAERLDSIDQAAEAGARGRARAAGTVVDDLNVEQAADLRDPDDSARGLRVLEDVVERLARYEVASRLDLRRETALDEVELDGQPR